MILTEGNRYDFRIIRSVILPDETRNWLLTHDGEDRYLLPQAYYQDYGIAEGMVIRCKVDKINCTGKIFLEPEHPVYKEGEVYTFTFIRSEVLPDNSLSRFRRWVLKGLKEDEHDCIGEMDVSSLKQGHPVKVRITMIRKGKLILEPVGDTPPLMEEEKGYPFIILKETEEGMFLAEGPGGIKTWLDKKHYPQYGLRPGKRFTGYFVKWRFNGTPHVEPEHPEYRPGEVYPFQVLRYAFYSHPFEKELPVFVVRDCYGNEIKVYRAGDLTCEKDVPESLLCKVVRLKKGKPVLKVV